MSEVIAMLDETAFATALASGVATATITPVRAFVYWRITMTSIESSSTVLVPRFKMYVGSSLVNSTFNGKLNTDSDMNQIVNTGQQVRGVWEAGDVGSRCGLTIQGEVLRR